MKQWTTHAEQRLSEYLNERTVREGLLGEEATDLKEDLRSHFHEEAERSQADFIGLMELERIIGHLDAGYRPAVVTPHTLPAAWGIKGFSMWAFGVVVPAAVLVFEMISSFCGGVFFDPVPTYWHAVWVALVPILNGWLLCGAPRGGSKLEGVAAGFVLFTNCFYAALFLPLIHLSVIALLFVGMGFLSLSPIIAAIASYFIGRKSKSRTLDSKKFRFGWRAGVGVSLFVLILLEGSALWTRANLNIAASGKAGAASAISRLRSYHSERALLSACYEGNRGTQMGTDISGWMLMSWQIPASMLGRGGFNALNSERTRDVFFRVTGKPFNSMKPPGNHRGGRLLGRVDPLEQVEFDDHLGGDDVAVRLKNLDLAESRLDGHVDTISRIGYGEWTMVFKNTSGEAKEARCQVKLPRDGRVSRLTLWVNGEPREAAFSTVSKVKAAYKSIAVVQRRDPVLVNVVGPDTVMVQCFPVPAHGEMKIRVGVTAPLHEGRWELPYIIERNFGTETSLAHAVWLQGNTKFDLKSMSFSYPAHVDGDGYSMPLTLDGAETMNGGVALLTAPLGGESPVVFCEDRFAKPEERFLIREPIAAKRPGVEKMVLVIDGSSSLEDAKGWLTRVIEKVGESHVQILLADDGVRKVSVKELGSYRFTGGRDNEPALREGIRMAKEAGIPVIWVHGPQAVGLSQTEALTQLLERGTAKPVVYEVEAEVGPNRLAEAIYRTGCLHRGPTLVSPEQDLARFLSDLRMTREEPSWKWKRSAAAPVGMVKVWDQLARFWAGSAVEDSWVAMTDSGRADLAARYQLVTPFSGAVVLETQQQYEQFGLTPADGDATPQIPNVPEPSAVVLLMISATAALLRRKRNLAEFNSKQPS